MLIASTPVCAQEHQTSLLADMSLFENEIYNEADVNAAVTNQDAYLCCLVAKQVAIENIIKSTEDAYQIALFFWRRLRLVCPRTIYSAYC